VGPERRTPCYAQRGISSIKGLPFSDETAQEELFRGGRSVGFIAIDAVQKPVDHKLAVGEEVEVNGVAYTVTAPGVHDGDSASLRSRGALGAAAVVPS
jgi:hypothetical protein